MKTIYIFTHGTTLRKIGRRLMLEKDTKKLFELPLKDVGRILIYSHTEVTVQTLNGLFDCNIPLIYVRRSGSVKGKLMPADSNHVLLRRRQYQVCGDDKFALPLAQAIIHTKICNMAAVIAHIMRDGQGTAAACQPMHDACRRLSTCNTREELMGVEGAAARHYFQIYGAALPEPFQFTVRSRRPAQDAGNALLNLGYMSLLHEVEGHLEAHNLDPYCGVLHVTEERRSSLALDLLEEFRQPVIDLFVLRLLNRQELNPGHFRKSDEGGIEMSDDGFKIFFRQYEERLGEQDGDNHGVRKLIDEQVLSFKKHLLGEANYHHLRLAPAQVEIGLVPCPVAR
jgi:CRISPR-associated protein Cas1